MVQRTDNETRPVDENRRIFKALFKATGAEVARVELSASTLAEAQTKHGPELMRLVYNAKVAGGTGWIEHGSTMLYSNRDGKPLGIRLRFTRVEDGKRHEIFKQILIRHIDLRNEEQPPEPEETYPGGIQEDLLPLDKLPF